MADFLNTLFKGVLEKSVEMPAVEVSNFLEDGCKKVIALIPQFKKQYDERKNKKYYS